MDSNIHPETVSATPYGQKMAKAENVKIAEWRGEHHVDTRVDTRVDYGPPTTVSEALGLLMGLDTAMALILPGICGAVLGWWVSGSFTVAGFVLSVLSLFCLIISLNIFAEYNDYCFGLRPESKYYDDESSFAGTNLITSDLFHAEFIIRAGALFLVAALLSTLILTFTVTGWPSIFFFAITGFLLAVHMLPPPWHGYLGWGLGEVGVLVGVGIIQVVSNYYVQRHMVDAHALLFGIPLGFFAVLVLFSRSLIRQRHDWMIRKRTFAVVLGQQHSVYFFIALIVLAYASLLLVVILTSLPLLLLLGLVTLPIAIGPFKRADDILQTPNDRVHLHRIMIKVMMCTGLLLMVLLMVEKAAQ